MVMNMFGKIVLAAAAVSSAMVVSAFAAGKVACVGNSITYGYGIESWPDQTSYPHHLQGMLRENAPSDTVENFGVSGLTVRKDDQASYPACPQSIRTARCPADTALRSASRSCS